MAVPTSASAGYTMPLFDWAAQQRSEPEPLHDGVGCSICGLVSSSRRQDATGRVVCESCSAAAFGTSTFAHHAPPAQLDALTGPPLQPVASTSKAAPQLPVPPPAPPVRDQRSEAEAPPGSCPGDGRCNGQGGQACCGGCPAFYNRYKGLLPTTAAMVARRNGEPGDGAAADAAAAFGVMQCENCETRTTPLWRRDGEGRVACNACGLYYKVRLYPIASDVDQLHGQHRPVNLKKPTITRRKRMPAAPKDTDRAGSAKRVKTEGGTSKKARKSAASSKAPSESGDSVSSPPPSARTPSSRTLPELAAVASRMLSEDVDTPAAGEGGTDDLPTTADELRTYRASLAEDIRRGRHEAQRMASRLDRAERVLASIDATLSTRSSVDGSAAPSPSIGPPPAQSPLDAFLEAIPIAASLPLRRRDEAAPAANGEASAASTAPANGP